MTPEHFLTFADPLPEPTLLLSGDGLILAGNRAIEERMAISLGTLRGKRLADVVKEQPDEVSHYLRLCCRSRNLVLGALTLKGNEGQEVPCRLEGALLRPRSEGVDATLILRLLPKTSATAQFVALNQRIDELGKEVQRRRRAEVEAREQGERLRVTLHSIGDAVVTTDPQGRVAMMNRVAQHLTGWSQNEAAGLPLETVFKIVNESSRQTVENPALRALQEGVIVGLANHTILISKEGLERPIDDSAAPIRDESGEVIGSVLVFRDITEQRRAARQSRIILESITDGFYSLDRQWRFTYVNRQAEELLARSREDLIGKCYWDEYPDTLGTQAEWHYQRAVAENVTASFEYFYPPHNRWYEVHAYPSSEGLSVYFRDVSQRREAEAVLRESEEKLRLLADTIPQLAWMARPDGHIFWYNRRWYEYTGTTAEAMEGWGWQAVHDPLELPNVLKRWQASIATGETFEMVFPLRGADGQYRSFLTRVNPFRDEHGKIIYWFGTNTDIEEQKRAQQALAESEQRFRQLADAMPQIVWTARPDGEIEYMNQRWHEFTGLPETPGNAGWASILHPNEAQSASERWAASVQSGQTFERELRLLDRQSQSYRWHLIRTVAVRDEQGKVLRWFGTSTDIDKQKRAEESSRYLAEASAALAGVVDYESTLQKVANLAVPYFADWSAVDVANDDGSLRRLAVAHQETSKVELVHQLMREYPPDPDSPSGAIDVLRTGHPQLIGEIEDQMLVQAAKDERHLELIRSLGLKSYLCVPLIVSSKCIGVLTFATAESGRTYTEADLALAMDLARRAGVAVENTQLYQALREADRRKDEFLATLAHELRNPLAPICNGLHILSMPKVDAETAQMTREMMERQVHHLVRLVDDLLDVSRVMRGKIELRKEPVELATVIARAVETARPLLDAQGHEFALDLRHDPLVLDADPVRLAQVIANLLTNAAKYTEPNGRIEIMALRDANDAVLRVRDNGIGIAPKMLPRIFELFVQADHSSTKAQGGLGIGLTLVKTLVEMHGGMIQAQSDGLQKGSEFIVRLPMSIRAPRDDRVSETVPTSASPVSKSGHRVLVVDDNKDAARSLAMLLGHQGHEVRIAHSGPAALETIEGDVPDVVFLDIGMPGMDGYEVARRIRQRPDLENMVLAALTGWGQQEDRRRTAEAGFDHHLVKPPDPKTLEHVLASLPKRY